MGCLQFKARFLLPSRDREPREGFKKKVALRIFYKQKVVVEISKIFPFLLILILFFYKCVILFGFFLLLLKKKNIAIVCELIRCWKDYNKPTVLMNLNLINFNHFYFLRFEKIPNDTDILIMAVNQNEYKSIIDYTKMESPSLNLQV